MTYNTYYTASDVQVYLSNSDSSRYIKIDTLIGITYNVNQTSTPIFDLGSRTARFFSSGNTVCNGYIMFAFTDEEYIKGCIDFVTTINRKVKAMSGTYRSERYGVGNMSNADFIQKSLAQINPTENGDIISIGAVNDLFDLKIYLNNETLITSSDTKMIVLKDCKLVSDAMEISSTGDSFLTQGYRIIFKDVKRY